MNCDQEENPEFCSRHVSRLNLAAMVTSKDVNKEIRRVIWPAIKEAGFGEFTARSAWRRHACAIDLLNFQSFNSYFASVDGCTTFSFGIELGVYCPPNSEVPWRREFVEPKIADRPAGYGCPARNCLRKTIRQPDYTRKDIWYVDRSGQNIVEVVANANYGKTMALERKVPGYFVYWEAHIYRMSRFILRKERMTDRGTNLEAARNPAGWLWIISETEDV